MSENYVNVPMTTGGPAWTLSPSPGSSTGLLRIIDRLLSRFEKIKKEKDKLDKVEIVDISVFMYNYNAFMYLATTILNNIAIILKQPTKQYESIKSVQSEYPNNAELKEFINKMTKNIDNIMESILNIYKPFYNK